MRDVCIPGDERSCYKADVVRIEAIIARMRAIREDEPKMASAIEDSGCSEQLAHFFRDEPSHGASAFQLVERSSSVSKIQNRDHHPVNAVKGKYTAATIRLICLTNDIIHIEGDRRGFQSSIRKDQNAAIPLRYGDGPLRIQWC